MIKKYDEQVILMKTILDTTNSPIEALLDYSAIEDMISLQSNQLFLSKFKRKKDKSYLGLLDTRLDELVKQYKEHDIKISSELQENTSPKT